MEYRNGEYFLTAEESGVLCRHLVCPDEAVMERRDRFFAQMDEGLRISYPDGGGMVIEALDLEIPALSKLLDESVAMEQAAFSCGRCRFTYTYNFSTSTQNRFVREAA